MKASGKGFGRFGTLLAGLGILVSVVVVAALVGDLSEFGHLWAELSWPIIICLLLLALVNHGLRYFRWQLLLKRVASTNFKHFTAMLLFSAGSLLIFTPARVGEVAKSVYARDFFGIPIATSLPVIIAERLVDVVVMAMLASLGLLLLGEPPNLLLAGIILVAALLVFVVRKPLLEWAARRRIARLRAGSKLGQMFNLAKESQLSLLTPGTLGTNLVLGSSAWMVEVIIYFLSLAAVGATMDAHLFILALAVFPLASLGGSISFLPGGLGATEAGLIALGLLLGGLSNEAVVLAALLSRAAILGVVILAGVVSLLLLPRLTRSQ